MDDGLKIMFGFLGAFAIFVIIMLSVVATADLRDCQDLQALYGDVVTWEQGFLITRCYATMPNGFLYELDGYGIDDHILLQELTQ
jgi:hypothetical protein